MRSLRIANKRLKIVLNRLILPDKYVLLTGPQSKVHFFETWKIHTFFCSTKVHHKTCLLFPFFIFFWIKLLHFCILTTVHLKTKIILPLCYFYIHLKRPSDCYVVFAFIIAHCASPFSKIILKREGMTACCSCCQH